MRKAVINQSQVSWNKKHTVTCMWKVDIISGITNPTFPSWRSLSIKMESILNTLILWPMTSIVIIQSF